MNVSTIITRGMAMAANSTQSVELRTENKTTEQV